MISSIKATRSVPVVIAHEHRFVSHSIAEFLRSNEFEIVYELEKPDQLSDLDFEVPPELCIIGYATAPGRFDADCALVRELFPDSRIVLLGADFSAGQMRAARAQGLSAYLSLRLTPDLIINGLRLVLAGHECYPSAPTLPEDVIPLGPAPRAGAVDLTPREGDVLRLISSGLANKVIARELDISESTVKAHMNSVLRKIGVSNRTQAACWAVENGFAQHEAPCGH